MAETVAADTPGDSSLHSSEGAVAVAVADAGVVEVAFRGERSGRAPLTWGQRAIWHAVLRTAPNDHYFNLGRVLPLGSRGRTVAVPAALAAIGALMARHEALRTKLVGDGGGAEQSLSADGTLPVTLVAAPHADAASRLADDLLDGLSGTRFDYTGEWPLRVALVTVDGLVTHAVLALCHLAADGHGAEVLVRDLRLLALRGSAGRPPATNPLDLAREQHGERGTRRGAAALDHWERGYRSTPPTMFPTAVAEPRSPRFWTGRIVSAAMARAVGAVAAAHRVSGSTVLLAASAALVAASGGHRTAAVMPIVGNRTSPALRDLVSTLSQDGLFVLDPGEAGADARFTDLLPDAYRTALRAYRASGYDPVEWDRLGERMRQERGTEVHPYCCFNDMRLVDRQGPAGPAPTREELAGARGTTRFDFPATQDRVACRYCLHITELGPALAVTLTADTAYLPPDAIRGHLYAMEHLIVESATGDAPYLGELPELLRRPWGEERS
ncbi:condensation domain-containing protein [Streptomyces sp. NPDC090231]|uniref:condensation domain-containing protein n=1 Tax=unclassified Streptomyces TaxID=2593676 RepID=UPI0037F767F4